MFENLDWRYWSAIIGSAIYAASKDADKAPIRIRLMKTAASMLFALAGSEDLAPYIFNSEKGAAVVLMAFGWFFLDIGTEIVTNPKIYMRIINRAANLPQDIEENK